MPTYRHLSGDPEILPKQGKIAPLDGCVYCGVPRALAPLTKEHVFGKWSQELSLDQNTSVELRHLLKRPSGERLIGAMQRSGGPRSQTLKIVCEECNGGWMSRLVERNITVLSQLVQGVWTGLSVTEKTNLASWITMFTMSHEFADRESVAVPQHERRKLMTSPAPSPNWLILIGKADTAPRVDPVYHRSLNLVSNGNKTGSAQVTVAVFGHLLIASVYHSQASPDYLDLTHIDFLQQIWPLRNDVLQPPIDFVSTDVPEVLIDQISAAMSIAY